MSLEYAMISPISTDKRLITHFYSYFKRQILITIYSSVLSWSGNDNWQSKWWALFACLFLDVFARNPDLHDINYISCNQWLPNFYTLCSCNKIYPDFVYLRGAVAVILRLSLQQVYQQRSHIRWWYVIMVA